LSVFHFIRKGKRLLCSFPENKEKLKFWLINSFLRKWINWKKWSKQNMI
jgi:hypothetical protein